MIDPPNTSDPISLMTGLDSPVSIDSLVVPCPKSTIPSTGTAEPGYTFTKSLTCISSMGTSLSGQLRLID